MAQAALTVAGYAVGTYLGGPLGGQIGAAIGSYIGGQYAISQQSFEGARLSDLKVPGLEYGSPVMRLWGRQRNPAPPIWMSEKREIATTTGGKGGASPEVTNYTYECDVLYLVADNEIDAVSRIWANGELVYSVLATSSDQTVGASITTDKWTDLIVYTGGGAQAADPTYEAAVGVGNAPAYRGRGTVLIEGLQLGASGQLPVLTFEVLTSATSSTLYVETAEHPPHTWTIVTEPNANAAPPLRWSGCGTSLLTLGDGLTYNDGSALYSAKIEAPTVAGGKRYAEIQVNTAGTSSATESYWLVVEDSAGNRYGQAYSGHYTVDGTVDANPYPTASTFYWVDAGAVVMRYAFDFDNGKLWISRNGGSWGGFNLATTTDPATNANGQPHTLNGAGMFFWIFADAAYPALSIELRTSVSQFDFDPPAGFIPWSSDGDTATVWTPADVDVADVVSDLCIASGLVSGQIDVTDLAGLTVAGVPVTQVSPARGTLQTLASAYYFECAESDKLYFVRRGGSVADTFTADDLVARDGADLVGLERSNDLEVPTSYALQYINGDGDYESGTVYSDRLVGASAETRVASMAVVMSPARAQGLVDTMALDSRVAATSLRPSIDTTTPRLQPSDVISLTDEAGITYRSRIVRETYADGVRALECVLDDASALTTSGTTTASTPSVTITLRAVTQMLVLDIPILRDADDAPGYYAAFKPYTGTWTGASLFTGTDGTAYAADGDVVNAATFGLATTALTSWSGGNVFDEASTVTVDVGAGTLASTTTDPMLTSDANAAAVGDEVVQFRTATYVSPGVYTLTGFLRGRRGTTWAQTGHAAGESFAMLPSAGTGILRIATSLAQIGTTVYHKPVTFGRSLTATTAVLHVDQSIGLKPFAPTDGRVARDTSNNATITWKRRSRLLSRFLAPGIDPPLGETSESYSVDIAATGAPSTVLRTITATSASASYTAAQQTADGITPGTAFIATVYQVSASVGRGYGLEFTA